LSRRFFEGEFRLVSNPLIAWCKRDARYLETEKREERAGRFRL